MDPISIRNAKNAKIGLHDLCQYMGQSMDLKKEIIIEIGSYVGDSTKIFSDYFLQVVAVDPWENGYDDTDAASYQHPMETIKAQFDSWAKGRPNVSSYQMTGNEFKHKFESAPAIATTGHFPKVVYIDGLHTYQGCRDDIRDWLPIIQRQGGFVCGHDYSQKKFPGVVQAVNEAFGKPDQTFSDTSWAVKIKGEEK